MPKPSVKKPAAKAAAKTAGKGSKTPPATKTPAKSSKPAPKAPTKPAAKPAAKGAPKPAAKAPAKATPPPAAATDPKKAASNRKGITIVTPKPAKKPAAKPSAITMPMLGSPLIKPGVVRKPLIASGPNAPKPKHIGMTDGKPKKSPFDKRELAKFKAILLRKRAELVGDVSTMETEALKGSSGSLSHLPQHMAEQGSDVYGQSLSLDLAAADRRLIKEIDDALVRIEKGTYGICELTGKPIRAERLEELPWARYSIEAAREIERRSTML
ncbi:MAG: TraR/DksA family transcriptional regulator [Phycisphaeraceae bacterium]|nr:TraR/DksA family transcriptional regulator [Phycisphaeraceae bacterium]